MNIMQENKNWHKCSFTHVLSFAAFTRCFSTKCSVIWNLALILDHRSISSENMNLMKLNIWNIARRIMQYYNEFHYYCNIQNVVFAVLTQFFITLLQFYYRVISLMYFNNKKANQYLVRKWAFVFSKAIFHDLEIALLLFLHSSHKEINIFDFYDIYLSV